ncbi:dTDP-4-dehydrorhamnose reductase [Methylococcus geothermalis]|uniref:dTDP-4-dehydrorhamnose reductase n=1 Tax=Methylococcus geothermalis TaxID=2681310 RepID=A0A858Q9E8_9GAMM|nr:dTDP-4-dehydrorhamnose reductase [Methylococcus geothermalis]QJD30499.1 dTDP-4-dehydrorhamnose reductase [Methylococcus geothermalis]
MKILVVGRAGQLAWELRRTLACFGEVVALDRHSEPAIDLAEPGAVAAVVRAVRPDLIVNAAAYTAVDRAEQEPELAWKVNAEAPSVLAAEAARLGVGLIHYSTDYVFPGDGAVPYREDDPVGPRNVYGRSKLAGEQAIAESGAAHVILRTAWVYGVRGQNFMKTMLRLMAERALVRVIDDQRGAPTWVRMIAEATAILVARSLRAGLADLSGSSGVYHLTCSGQTSWYGFACAIREQAVAAGLLPDTAARVEPIPTSEYPTPAQRPAYSVLDLSKLEERFGIAPPDWRHALELCLADLAGQ